MHMLRVPAIVALALAVCMVVTPGHSEDTQAIGPDLWGVLPGAWSLKAEYNGIPTVVRRIEALQVCARNLSQASAQPVIVCEITPWGRRAIEKWEAKLFGTVTYFPTREANRYRVVSDGGSSGRAVYNRETAVLDAKLPTQQATVALHIQIRFDGPNSASFERTTSAAGGPPVGFHGTMTRIDEPPN